MKKIVIEDTVQGRIIRLSIERDATAEQIVDKLKKRYKGLREQDLVLLHGEALLEAGDIALDKVKNDGGGKAARFELCMVELDEEQEEDEQQEEEDGEPEASQPSDEPVEEPQVGAGDELALAEVIQPTAETAQEPADGDIVEGQSAEQRLAEDELSGVVEVLDDEEDEDDEDEEILAPEPGVVEESMDEVEIISSAAPLEEAPHVEPLGPLAEALGEDSDPAAVSRRISEVVQEQSERIVDFMLEICAIPSMDGEIREVGERIAQEMELLGYDEVRWDQMGNIIGRIGDGPRSILFDSHIDTVGVGDPDAWEWDPFTGKVEDRVLYARGASDEKGSTPGMIYGPAIARDLGLLDGWTAYYFGNMEEWCDGIAPHALVEAEGIRPDMVVIGEPTKMQIYRGHKGRVEMRVVAKGRSAHAASNELGDNAIYKLLPVIEGVALMGDDLPEHEFLGKGRITVTDMEVKTPSINAVPDEATLYIDRRVTFGEEVEQVIHDVRNWIPESDRETVQVEMLHYDEPSYTGFTFPVDKYFPAWALAEDHELVQAGQRARELLWGEGGEVGKWNFSTNGIYWMGKAEIPSIGFGPGDEIHAHTTSDQVRLDDVVQATSFYALLPSLLSQES